MRHLDLFSGMGMFAWAAMQVWDDYECAGFCDIDPYARQLLKIRFPGVKVYDNIRTLSAGRLIADSDRHADGKKEKHTTKTGKQTGCVIDLLTGGFPCQPFSQAGHRKGTGDDRHLWPEMFRVIRETHPRWVIGENVKGFVSIDNGMVLKASVADLEREGYAVQCFIIPACAVGAPHRRDRVWIVAHTGQQYGERQTFKGKHGKQDKQENAAHIKRSAERYRVGVAANTGNTGPQRQKEKRQGHIGQQNRNERNQGTGWHENWLEVAAKFCRVDDGRPVELDGFELSKAGHRASRLKALGNGIVPQVAIKIMEAIKYADQ